MVHNYITAMSYLQRGRSKREWWRNERPLARNTYLRMVDPYPDGDISVRYWATDVVTYHRDESVTIDTGGWWTKSTLARIRTFAPMIPQVFRQNNKLWLSIVTGYTPEKRIRCSVCQGSWADPATAVLIGAPSPCRCWGWSNPSHAYRRLSPDEHSGTVLIGGNPRYQRWDGQPLTYDGMPMRDPSG